MKRSMLRNLEQSITFTVLNLDSKNNIALENRKREDTAYFFVAMNNCGTDYLCIVAHRAKPSTIHLPGLYPMDLSWCLNIHGRKMSSPNFNFYGSSGYSKPCPGEYQHSSWNGYSSITKGLHGIFLLHVGDTSHSIRILIVKWSCQWLWGVVFTVDSIALVLRCQVLCLLGFCRDWAKRSDGFIQCQKCNGVAMGYVVCVWVFKHIYIYTLLFSVVLIYLNISCYIFVSFVDLLIFVVLLMQC